MRFLMAVIDSLNNPGGPEEPGANDRFNEKIESAGQRILAAGICDPTQAVVFDNRQGRGLISPGPLTNADDYMAGFWVIDVEDEESAHALAIEASKACNRRIELRSFLR